MTKSAGHNPGGRTANAHQMMLSGPDGRVLDEYQKVDVIARTADVECVVVTVRGGDRFPKRRPAKSGWEAARSCR